MPTSTTLETLTMPFKHTALNTLLAALLGTLVSPAIPAFANAPFGPTQTIASGVGGANNVAAHELDGVNGLDVFYGAEGSQTLGVALRQAGGGWSTQTLTPGSRMRDVVIGDLDGDGDHDLIYGDFNGNRVYWRSNDLDTSGTFLARQSLATVGRPQGLYVIDLDGDTDLDVLVAGRTSDGYFWIENTAGDASSWTLRTIASGVNAAQYVVAADLDGDGDLDVAGGSSSGSGKLAWYENVNGDAMTWLGRDIYSSRINAVEAGDLDLDGDVDLLVQDINDDDILWWENTAGDGTAWTRHTISSFPGSRKGLQAVDLDFDGDLDVVGDPNADWWENIDKATSWTRRSFDGGSDLSDVDAVDVDGDGDRDIVGVRNTANNVLWWENLTCSPGDADDDSDGVRNGCDVCDGFDDTLDADGDLTPDGCDLCPGFDDRVDNDNDTVPDACASAATIAIDNVTAAEGDSGTTSFTFTVTLSGTVTGGFTVPYATQDQSATVANGDYTADSGTLTFAGTDGEQQTLTILVHGDLRVENDDAFLVVLGAPSSGSVTVDDDTGVGTLFNDDTASLSIDDPSMLEGDSGTSGLTLTVTSTGEVDGGFTVDFVSGDNSATLADGDYVADSGTLTFLGTDGEQQTITIQVVGDTKVEADEQFTVQLRNPSRPAILIPDGTGRPVIQNDDSATLAIDDVTQLESIAGSIFQFTVTLSGEVGGGFTVPFNTVDGTATAADSDYTANSGILSFVGADGETQVIDIAVVNDPQVEPDETFTVQLGTPSLPIIGVTDAEGLGTITNDDAATLAIDDVSQDESDAGTTFQFTVTLTGEVAGGFTVPFSTADGTATVVDGDYNAAAGSLSFSGAVVEDGENQTIDVLIPGDTVVEDDESFTVQLGTPSKPDITATDSTGLGTLRNDDTATIAIDDVTQDETDAGTTFSFTVTLTGEVAGGFTLPYSTLDGTATVADGDYTAASGNLSFVGTNGETQTIDVTILGDTVVENDETFTVNLGTASKTDVTATDNVGLGTLRNDDAATVAIDDVIQDETDAGTTFQFTVTLNGDVAGGFTLPFSTADGTATASGADADYTAASGNLSFLGTNGETQTIDVTVLGDTVVENDESFTVHLGIPSKPDITATDDVGLGTLRNDDSASIDIDSVIQDESDTGTTFSFTVTLTGDVAGGFTVPFSTTDGTATASTGADGDYNAVAGSLTFSGNDGETQNINVTILGDTVVEGDEAFTVHLGTPSVANVTVAVGSGVGTLRNDDAATLSIDDVSQVESDAGTSFQFAVTLSEAVAGGLTVDFSTTKGTATTADYTPQTGTLTFAGTAGEIQTIDIPVTGDTVVEPDETFFVRLGTPSHSDVAAVDAIGLGTIQNDDSATIAVTDVAQLETEGDTVFTFTVALTGEVDGGFTLAYSTVAGTASSGSDYTPVAAILSFVGTAGESQNIDVTVRGDSVVEADETFTVELGTPSDPNVTAGDSIGLGTIQNDDSATVAIDDVIQTESDAGTTFQFTVSLTGDVAAGFTVPFATVDGSATVADGDYSATSGTLTFSGFDSETQTIDVPVTGDPIVEATETFTVELGTPSNGDISASDDTAIGTIENDDSATVAIDDVSQAETDTGTTFQFSVSLTGDVAAGFTVPYATADGSATITDGDYTATSGTLTFSGLDGETQTLDVPVTGDPIVEADETFTVELGIPSNSDVSATDGSGLGTIQNDDSGAFLTATKEIASYEPPFDRVVYLITITNLGDGHQTDDPSSDELEDLLPPELRIFTASSDHPSFTVTTDDTTNAIYGNGPLAPDETVTVTLEAVVTAEQGDEVSNQALIRFDTDHDGVNDTSEVTDDPSTSAAGDSTTFLVSSVLDIPTLDSVGLVLMIVLLIVVGVRMTGRVR